MWNLLLKIFKRSVDTKIQLNTQVSSNLLLLLIVSLCVCVDDFDSDASPAERLSTVSLVMLPPCGTRENSINESDFNWSEKMDIYFKNHLKDKTGNKFRVAQSGPLINNYGQTVWYRPSVVRCCVAGTRKQRGSSQKHLPSFITVIHKVRHQTVEQRPEQQ